MYLLAGLIYLLFFSKADSGYSVCSGILAGTKVRNSLKTYDNR